MKSIKDIVYEYIGYTKKISISDFSEELQKTKGIKRLLRTIAFKLTWWMIEPVVLNFNHQVDLNLNFYHYSSHLEEIIALHKAELEQLALHRIDYENFKKRALNDYNQWIAQNEPTEVELRNQRGHKLSIQPEISFILFVKDKQLGRLDELIYSLRAQTYNQWRLYIATDSADAEHKIQKLCIVENRIISCGVRSPEFGEYILELAAYKAKGDYIGFLFPDDTLAPFALFEMVKTINELPDADLLYGDEDKVKEHRRFEPVYKPGYAPDTLRSTNYIGDFFIIKRNLLNQIEKGMGFSGDLYYEIILHAFERTTDIYRVPKIINHKRLTESVDINKHVVGNGKNSEIIKSHISGHLGLECTVDYTGVEDIYRVDYLVAGNPKVSILIPNKDHTGLLKSCIESIMALTTYDNYEIIIIENNSSERETFIYYNELEKSDSIRVIYYPGTKFNYQKIINYGVKNCTGDYILQLNNDIKLLTPNWLELMLGFAQRSDIGAVGAKLYYPDKSIQHAGGIFTQDEAVCEHIFRYMPNYAHGYKNRDLLIQNVSWVTGACVMSRKEIYEEVGFMTEEFEVSFGDIDFCMKIRDVGKSIIFHPFVRLIHYECKTRGHLDIPERVSEFAKELELFTGNWQSELERGDSFYTPGMEKLLFDRYGRDGTDG